MKRRALFGVLVVLFVLAGVFLLPRKTAVPPRLAAAPAQTAPAQTAPAQQAPSRCSAASPAPARLGQPATRPLPPFVSSDPAMRSPLADELLARGSTPAADMAIVLSLCDHFREICGGMPVGTNAEIVNALTGNNPKRIALIARDHPAIDAAGELTDRWGTPFFFHNVARDLIGIRSAGPDREMYSADDLLTASPRLRAAAP